MNLISSRSRLAIAAVVWLVATLVGGMLIGRTPEASADIAARKTPVSEAVRKAQPSVVSISSTTVMAAQQSPFMDPFMWGEERPQICHALGSGVIVSQKGLILTNNHVIANARAIQVSTSDGSDYQAEVVGAKLGAADERVTQLAASLRAAVEPYLGRSLQVAAPDEGGTVILDFNRATNLPCAYTEFATCPLPPAGNRLPVAVEAGEQILYEANAKEA